MEKGSTYFFAKIAEENFPELHKELPRKFDKIEEYYKCCTDVVDNFPDKIQQMAKDAAQKHWELTDQANFATGPDWIAYQIIRIYNILFYVHAVKKMRKEALSDEKYEKDCMDANYVTMLSKAHILLTKDTKLQIPLAEAAYPDKAVLTDANNLL